MLLFQNCFNQIEYHFCYLFYTSLFYYLASLTLPVMWLTKNEILFMLDERKHLNIEKWAFCVGVACFRASLFRLISSRSKFLAQRSPTRHYRRRADTAAGRTTRTRRRQRTVQCLHQANRFHTVEHSSYIRVCI